MAKVKTGKSKNGNTPAPSPRLNSAYLRMDRAKKQKAGTSLKESQSTGSNNRVMFDHMLRQNEASKNAVARSRGNK